VKLTNKDVEYLIDILEAFEDPDDEDFKEVLIGKLENLETETDLDFSIKEGLYGAAILYPHTPQALTRLAAWSRLDNGGYPILPQYVPALVEFFITQGFAVQDL
jgi:hypothetical protein